MKKVQLHWQILIALVLAIVFGILFPTSYMVSEKSTKSLMRKNTDPVIITAMEQIKDVEYGTRAEFYIALDNIMTADQKKNYSATVAEAAYHNPHVRAVSWMGDLFLRALKMIIIPLILSSLITGVTNIGTGGNLPTSAVRANAHLTYGFSPKLSATGYVNVTSEKNDDLNLYDFERDVLTPGISLLAMPDEMFVLTGGASYSRVKSNAKCRMIAGRRPNAR